VPLLREQFVEHTLRETGIAEVVEVLPLACPVARRAQLGALAQCVFRGIVIADSGAS